MTNQEWLQHADKEELAKFLAWIICSFWSYEPCVGKNIPMIAKTYLEDWLNREHKEDDR